MTRIDTLHDEFMKRHNERMQEVHKALDGITKSVEDPETDKKLQEINQALEELLAD